MPTRLRLRPQLRRRRTLDRRGAISKSEFSALLSREAFLGAETNPIGSSQRLDLAAMRYLAEALRT
jgi:hypothetical protein